MNASEDRIYAGGRSTHASGDRTYVSGGTPHAGGSRTKEEGDDTHEDEMGSHVGITTNESRDVTNMSRVGKNVGGNDVNFCDMDWKRSVGRRKAYLDGYCTNAKELRRYSKAKDVHMYGTKTEQLERSHDAKGKEKPSSTGVVFVKENRLGTHVGRSARE